MNDAWPGGLFRDRRVGILWIPREGRSPLCGTGPVAVSLAIQRVAPP